MQPSQPTMVILHYFHCNHLILRQIHHHHHHQRQPWIVILPSTIISNSNSNSNGHRMIIVIKWYQSNWMHYPEHFNHVIMLLILLNGVAVYKFMNVYYLKLKIWLVGKMKKVSFFVCWKLHVMVLNSVCVFRL